ncbi:hypothetical protein Bca4012_065671 [Brassica carinata]
MNSRWHLGWRDRWKAVVVHRRKENCRSLMKNSPEKTRYFASPHKKKRLQSRSVRVKKSRKRNVSREDERLDDSKDGGAKKGRHEQVAEGFTAATKGPPALGKKAFGVVLILAKDFREYADFVFQEYGGKVKHWITFNEPWVYSHAGYDIGKKAPGRCSTYVNPLCQDGRSGYEAYLVSHNLLNSHAEAVEAFRKCEKCKGGKIGIAHSPAWFEPHDFDDSQDGASIDRALDFMMGWHLDTTTFGDYPQKMKDIVGHRLPKFTAAQKAKLKDSTDFVGLNYYTSKFSNHLEKPDYSKPRWMQDSLISWETKNAQNYSIGSRPFTAAMEVYSKGLRNLLKYIKDKYANPEIMIMENGYGDILGDTDSVKNGTADHNRKYYLQRHLLSMYEAICIDKVNVTGYFIWSLLDNFEWQDGYKNRFGLYYIDFKNNLTRHEKESAKYYKEFLSEGTRPSKIKRDEL